MAFPQKTKQRYLYRFDQLIAEGSRIPQRPYYKKDYDPLTGNTTSGEVAGYFPERLPSIEWQTKVLTLLYSLLPQNHALRDNIKRFSESGISDSMIQEGMALLKALKDDFENGFLDDIAEQIMSEVSSDYLSQANNLLKEGHAGKFDHVPAAVLAGAVLENFLKELCQRQNPIIDILKSNGEPKRLSLLVDDLKKTGVYNETMAKQLRAWADIRNHAAHGEFDQFNRQQVEAMLSGIDVFLAQYS
jgi:hypothetical protein